MNEAMSHEQIGALIPLVLLIGLYVWGHHKNIRWLMGMSALVFFLALGYLLTHWREMGP